MLSNVMMIFLAIVAGVTGLAVTASAVLLAWTVVTSVKRSKEGDDAPSDERTASQAPFTVMASLRELAPLLLRWTYFDYAVLALLAVGGLFLWTDLVAVIRDSESFPPYHLAYLLCGFVFVLAACFMLTVRFAVVLSMVRPVQRGSAAAMEDDQDEPSDAKHAEERV
ncbi:hypothetical protein [Paenibacillus sp. YYML68]|uniref:hypothetical protein n=1 Tax=Paenibacillus sp. YYML68 TaxID=2909250 RepID=UPI00249168CD|nr:hypothetical protein [Paenibacillus sp. YYML68]